MSEHVTLLVKIFLWLLHAEKTPHACHDLQDIYLHLPSWTISYYSPLLQSHWPPSCSLNMPSTPVSGPFQQPFALRKPPFPTFYTPLSPLFSNGAFSMRTSLFFKTAICQLLCPTMFTSVPLCLPPHSLDCALLFFCSTRHFQQTV